MYKRQRDNILNGTYKENDELRETAIGKELGVSRTPVREALRQLELEGLVTIIPNRGTTAVTAKLNMRYCHGNVPLPKNP